MNIGEHAEAILLNARRVIIQEWRHQERNLEKIFGWRGKGFLTKNKRGGMMGNHANKRAAAARHNAAYVAKAEKPNKRKLITEKVRRFFDDLLDLVESTWHSRAVMRLEWRYFKTKYLWG